MRHRGVSLVELMLVCGLLATLLLIGLQSGSGSRAQADSRGLAEALAGRLAGAREQAMRLGEPVALAFPSQNGATAHAVGCYRLQGFERAREQERWSFGGEFPDTCVYSGFWGGTAEWLERQRDCAGSGLSMATWPRPHPRDPVVVFLPNGSALSSQPLVNGAYRLVVCASLEAGAGSLLGRPTSVLRRVQAPVTLSVTPQGRVSVEPGLVPAGAEIVTRPLATVPGAAPALLSAGANAVPALSAPVQVEPPPIVSGLPTGIDATVGADSHLSLIVRASDSDGDRLSCTWRATGPPGEPAGSFGHPGEGRMAWDEAGGGWVSRWEWSPPPGAEGKIYTLEGAVRDERGAQVELRLGASGRVLVVPRGRIAFQGAGGTEIELSNADGSDRTSLTRGRHASVCNPEFSPDGSKLLFLAWQGGGPNDNRAIVMDADGRDEIVVASGPIVGASWTPDGTQIVYTVFRASPRQLEFYVTRLGDHVPGPAPAPLAVGTLPYSSLAPDPDVRDNNATRSFQASWAPSTDRRFLASFPRDHGGGWRWELAEVLVDGGSVSYFGIEGDSPRLDSAGEKVLFLDDTGLSLATAPYSAPGGGAPGTLGAKTTLPVSFGSDLGRPAWSPDSSQIVLDQGGQLYMCDSAGNNLRPLDPLSGGRINATWTL